MLQLRTKANPASAAHHAAVNAEKALTRGLYAACTAIRSQRGAPGPRLRTPLAHGSGKIQACRFPGCSRSRNCLLQITLGEIMSGPRSLPELLVFNAAARSTSRRRACPGNS